MAAPEYATYTTAKVAKEKGFEPPVSSNYLYWDVLGRYIRPYEWYTVMQLPHILHAPTQAELQKWIRETHEIHVEIYSNASGWGWILTKLNGTTIKEIRDDIFFETYEQALETGMVKALQKIKTPKK